MAKVENVTKKALVDLVTDSLEQTERKNISQATVGRMVDCLLSAIAYELKEGRSVALKGFGTFKAGMTKARKARNPKTGEDIDVAPKMKAHFKPSKELLS